MVEITLFAGGVGGAKMAESLSLLDNISLNVISNIADDDDFHGLYVSPDVDTLIYTLSKKIDRCKGWGVKSDTFKALDVLKGLGNETWMNLGDADLGLHIYRTQQLKKNILLSQITKKISKAFNIKCNITVPTNDKVRTKILTNDGWLSFQEFFVRERCSVKIKKIKFEGVNKAKATLESISYIKNADIIVFAPSNPIVSISPIIKIDGINKILCKSRSLKVAVSPIIQGRAIKGPAREMLIYSGYHPNVLGVAQYYKKLIDVLIIDKSDKKFTKSIESLGIKVLTEDILLKNNSIKYKLAKKISELV